MSEQQSDENHVEKTITPEVDFTELLNKLQPLLAGGRLNNVVDMLSLLSDVVDIADNALVEKLAGVFEGVVAVGWESGNALRIANTELRLNQESVNYRSLYSLFRDRDTLVGITLLLRTLQIIGQRINATKISPS
ncbi:TPA: hypothetical protein ACPZUD_000144 [Yersinia enterocolitica]|uniref:hypothetical protein n=1 Tax=Yersinia enterocolitica TaxID=630 RepID=UPI0029B2F079|nr:hypothetical protein [Yersinia enterocolitica]EKN5147610.1 hypothetical protein [Yersinia enterocolitica]HEI6718902.1 hypothetical protein [Yersinia enterocolitica]HEI6782001.1 hypothetical protein [Yersinia enterocolitica]HEI6820046.1 hypothetical protein [Yersinia enterocolitica]